MASVLREMAAGWLRPYANATALSDVFRVAFTTRAW